MVQIEVRGSKDVDRLVKAIKTHADAKAIRKELMAALNRESKPIRADLKAAIPAALPRRGGLAAQIAATTSFTTSAKGGRYAGITIWARNRGHDIRTLTGKRLRHPVYGNRGVWVNQTAGVTPTVLTKTFQDQKPDVKRALVRACEDIARKLTRGR